jgi:hypothetical protein
MDTEERRKRISRRSLKTRSKSVDAIEQQRETPSGSQPFGGLRIRLDHRS